MLGNSQMFDQVANIRRKKKEDMMKRNGELQLKAILEGRKTSTPIRGEAVNLSWSLTPVRLFASLNNSTTSSAGIWGPKRNFSRTVNFPDVGLADQEDFFTD
jgi:hypothetical protein